MEELLHIYIQNTSTGQIWTWPFLGFLAYMFIVSAGIYGWHIGYKIIRK